MTSPRIVALAPVVAFASLAGVLATSAGLPLSEALVASLAVAAALSPSGWLVPAGWRRRLAELALLPAALTLTLVADPIQRQTLMPPLLVVAAAAAVAAARARTPGRFLPVLAASLGLAVRAAGGLGLAAFPPLASLLAVAAAAVAPWGVARFAGLGPGAIAALAIGALPLQRWPLVAVALVVLGVAGDLRPRPTRRLRLLAAGWLPGLAALALVASCLAPWAGIAPALALPGVGWPTLVGLCLALLITPRLPPALAGAAWLVVACLLGPLEPAPPDRPGLLLWPERPTARLPEGDGSPYLLELALGNAPALADGTPVAVVVVGRARQVVRAGEGAAEWAHERPDVRPTVAHGLPEHPVWRPSGDGAGALWGVAGRTMLDVPAGVRPVVRRHAGLSRQVALSVATAGPSRPTPPRRRSLPWWLATTAAVVALVQLAAGRWSAPDAWLPWSLLATGTVVAHLPLAPMRLLGERHAVDLALAALLVAWAPAAWASLRNGRRFLAAASLLAPIALATPQLTPPMYGDEPFHLLVCQSLAEDHDLDLSDDLDVEHHPDNQVYTLGEPFFHSPATGILLFPGYLVAGRSGALLLLALAGSLLVALVLRRAGELGVPASRLVVLGMLLVATYPLATFSSQIWTEVLGGLAVAAGLVVVARPGGRPWVATALALAATALKTRLALLTFPVALAGWSAGPPRRRRLGLAALAVAAAASLLFGWLTMGHPFGHYRRLRHLVPHDLGQALTVVGGLLFDPAGGLLFSAPILLVALAGLPLLWRRGGTGERALLFGGALTLAALLHSKEWYGGGSPPARYLAPLLPLFALAAAALLRSPRPWRRLASILVGPSLIAWWALVTRPHFSVNPGDGGYWLADALARRLGAETRVFFPSFLVPAPATVLLPLALAAAVGLLALLARRPRALRALVAGATTLWLLAGAALVAAATTRVDRHVEAEAPQVARLGGRPEPPPGTFSRFTHRLGWRLANREGIEAPLKLDRDQHVRLEAWPLGRARIGAELVVRWDGGEPATLAIDERRLTASLPLPDPPGPGRHRLAISLRCRGACAVVLDRIVVEP